VGLEQMFTGVADKFLIYGDLINAVPIKKGHINETYLLTFNQAGATVQYILRKINKFVFHKPAIVVQNTVNVIEHISKKLLEENEKEISVKVMTLIKSKDHKYFYKDKGSEYWCAVLFLENSYSVDCVETTDQAYMAAKEFGRFQKYLIDDDVNKYQPTIPDFHNIKKRLKLFQSIIRNNQNDRVKKAKEEISQVLSNRHLSVKIEELMKSKTLPIRITHNDTKINNVLLDKNSGKGKCVIDLDTVMPGTVIYDFGDLVRTSASSLVEDDPDIKNVRIKKEYFDAVVKGYLEELNGYLVPVEITNLLYGAKLIIYEQAIRFLTDYIMGDLYYRTNYTDHNLIRTRNQLALLMNLQDPQSVWKDIIYKYSGIKAD
jgi:hypothetical protein